jgi:glycerol-3-phosphate dehydrogenase
MSINMHQCDVLVVGGGINGAGIARDAVGRGLRTVLCEKNDLASHTSSASTKLVHGGLRYLEQLQFGLVRKALIEREVLLRAAPHIIQPLKFLVPHDSKQRPFWVIRIGLLIYDQLAKRQLLDRSRSIDLRQHVTGQPLTSNFTCGFSYADAWVDDARLVVLNVLDAFERGCTVLTHTTCEKLEQKEGYWHATLSRANGDTCIIKSRSVVNSTGAWASQFLNKTANRTAPITNRLIKGSHIVVKKLFSHEYAYLFQHSDGRVIFAIPYEHDFTLIGTTDIEYKGNVDEITISPDEANYLCNAVSLYFNESVTTQDIVWSYAGVRPLQEEEGKSASTVSRDYRLDLQRDGAPLLNVFGGKLTTYRKLAEEAVDLLAPVLANHNRSWTANACLPGGNLLGESPSNQAVHYFEQWCVNLQNQYAWLSPKLTIRYAKAYGTRIHVMLSNCNSIADMGLEIVPGVYAVEVLYLIKHEWARCADDILWRRSKCGLHLSSDSQTRLDAWMQPYLPTMV